MPLNIMSSTISAVGIFFANCSHESIAVTFTSPTVMPISAYSSAIISIIFGVSFAVAGFSMPISRNTSISIITRFVLKSSRTSFLKNAQKPFIFRSPP